MGKNTKAVKEFINSIPTGKLSGFPLSGRTIYKDKNFRLDMQGMTSGDPKQHNLQVQVNRETTISTLKKADGDTVAFLLVSKDKPPSAEKIKSDLISKITI